MRVEPYLVFNGQCEEAFNFYKSIFGGEFSQIVRFKDMAFPGMKKEEENQLMRVSLPLGEHINLMGSDSPSSVGQTKIGDNVSISLGTFDADEAKRIFEKLSAGGKVKMQLQRTEWANLYAMWTDKFGINWMISQSDKK